jgi:signal transduction histidine kinase/DNA-binding response OmpR family regulator
VTPPPVAAPETPAAGRLLIVDDEAPLMQALCNTLELEGYRTTGFTSARRALAELHTSQFDLLLTDLMMPEMDGIELLRSAQHVDRDLAGIMMTGHGTIDTAVKALQAGALDYILKPFRLDNLLPVLTRALTARRLQSENIRLREAISIYELSRAITQGLTHEQVIERTLSSALQQNDAGAAWLLEPSGEPSRLQLRGLAGECADASLESDLEVNGAVEAWVADVRESLASWDGSAPVPLVLEHPFRAHNPGIALPVVSDGRLFGILRFVWRSPQRRISPGQIKALDILASTAASALATASLVSQLRGVNQELEQRVQARTRELEASNADLEAFSYSVSHDLRSPLNAVSGFCEAFVSDHGQNLTPEGRGLLDRVLAGVARMHRLIDDLLHLARFSRQPLETQPLSLTDLAQRVARSLEPQYRGRAVELTIDPLPMCQGDPSLLEHVLTNLLSNALKFTAARTPARIEVGALRYGPEYAYYVKDNGVGFDMKYADRLFGVFQRLHRQDEFPGTGIGLSIVQRIVKRHGGRTWAEGRLNEGATVYFTLPPAPGTASDTPDLAVTQRLQRA